MRVLGLMSGTSLDGIDAAVLETDGMAIKAFGPAATFAYFPEEKRAIQTAIEDALHWKVEDWPNRPKSFPMAEKAITEAHIRVVEQMLDHSDTGDIDLIGFHGQTIVHRPDQKMTLQLGDGAELARRCSIDVVGDFRSGDVASGGQGAPLVPIYHQALLQGCDLDYPVAVLNIGGVANLTYVDGSDELIAFDTGPGNGLLDQWMVSRGLGDYDKDGGLSAKGQVNEKCLCDLMEHPYFKVAIPKSLDRYDFSLPDGEGLSDADGAATLAAFSAAAIVKAIDFLPTAPKLWIVCGGGRKNCTIMSLLAAQTGAKCMDADELSWRGDDVEAEAFAYLAARHINHLPITFPGTTGVKQPATGGVLFKAS